MFCRLLIFFAINSVLFAAPLYTNINPTTKSSTASTACSEQGDCLTVTPYCTEPCGCDYLYYYNKTSNECLLNLEYLKQMMTERFNSEETPDFGENFFESPWATKLRADAERVFGGIIISVIIFGACMTLCTVTACLYCININYSDRKLRKDIKALSQKLNRDGKPLKKTQRKPTEDIAQSCNVVVEDAGVFVC